MKTFEEFCQYRDQVLRSLLVPIREESLKAVGQVWRSFWISLAATLVAFLLAFLYSGKLEAGLVVGGIALALGLLVCYVQYTSMSSARSLAFKHHVVRRIVEFIDPELKYLSASRIPTDLFISSGIFTRTPDRVSGEDLVKGRYSGVELSFSELHAEYMTTTTDSKGRTVTQWHDIFKGVFMVADFNKDFHTRTVVLPDSTEGVFGSYLGGILQKLDFTRSGQLVKLESPDFEKAFAVYGEDQVEARYILTPALMERILALRESFGDGLALSFAGSKLFLAMPMGRNLFEVDGSSIESPGLLDRVFSDMSALIGVVDILNLTTRIWTKE
jgi:hypothetical protein